MHDHKYYKESELSAVIHVTSQSPSQMEMMMIIDENMHAWYAACLFTST